MARRRQFAKGPRRLTSWISGRTDATALTTAAGLVREVTLFVPLEDHEGATIIRIVGSVGIWPTQDSTFPQTLAWGIYKAGSGSDGDLQMDPLASLDRESEHWMHMQFVYRNKNVTNTTGSNIMYSHQDDLVDIRVMRKVMEGDGIKIAFNGTQNYASMANLRILLKHT